MPLSAVKRCHAACCDRQRVGFNQKHGHVSCMACITPASALALHFSRCSFAHSLNALTIASFDIDDLGQAERIVIVSRSVRPLRSFNARPFVKAGRATLETNSKQKIFSSLPL